MYRPTAAGGVASSTPIQWWQVRAAEHADGVPFGAAVDNGGVVSRPDYRADGWCIATGRSTVMAAPLGAGLFPNIEYSTNLRDLVDRRWFEVPWWYRTTFTARGGARTALQLDGVIHKADLFVNGSPVAGADVIAGAYTCHYLDVSHLIRPRTNALALKVYPGSPLE